MASVLVMSQVAGQNPKPTLACGVWPVGEGGDDNFYANTILPTGLQVTDTAAEASLAQIHTDTGTTLHTDLGTLHTDLGTTNSDLATIVTNTTVVAPAGHVRCFQCTPNGVTTGALLIVAASADGLGKKVTNASVQGGANGVDMWTGPAGVTNLTGDYLPPGGVATFSGREAIYVYATAPGGICTMSEEYP